MRSKDFDQLAGDYAQHGELGLRKWLHALCATKADGLADENRRDELLEAFQVHYHAGGINSIEGDVEEEDDELEEDDQEVGRE